MIFEGANKTDLLKCIDQFMDKGLLLQPVELPTYFLCKKLIEFMIGEDLIADEAEEAKKLNTDEASNG